jgi:flagellar assembly factor FliW
MIIETKYQGEIEIGSEEIINFERGIPGFEDEKNFVILPFAEETPFYILQSTKTSELAFVMTEPFLYFKGYEVELSNELIEELAIEKENDVLVFSILTVQEPFEKTTVNLQAPIVVNRNHQKGKQVVLNNTNTNYKTKHLLFVEPSEEKEEVK